MVSHNPASATHLRRAFTSRQGATFIELLVAFAVLLGFATVALIGFTQFNRYAASSRLRAQALSLAEQQIESIMTASWQASGTVPTILTTGTTTATNIPLNTDTTNNQTGLSSIYTDYVALAGQVRATRTTVIATLTTRSVRATVTVAYTYAGRSYSIVLTTLRVTDTI